MLQTFTSFTRPEQGPPRLAALRAQMQAQGLQGFIVPRADAHQGEAVAPCDERLAWLTGFTGSAGVCVVLPDLAGLFIDGRYRLQVRAQSDMTAFTPVDFPDTQPGAWIAQNLPEGVVGYDPWLHSASEIARIEAAFAGRPLGLRPVANLVDAVWPDRPAAPDAPAFAHPEALAGASAADKRARLAKTLRADGQRAAVLTLPDSICWLLNIRGGDVARTPILRAFAILHDDARITLFADPAKFDAALRTHLGPEVEICLPETFTERLRALTGPVRVDRASAPVAVGMALQEAGIATVAGDDPCRLPKACKTAAELAGIEAAHLRDGAAMVEFLCWLETALTGVCAGARLTEIDVVRALEARRQATGALHDLSFETICGSGPNGAIVHYRVTEATDRTLVPGDVLLIDSGGQYPDGTTDVTRTIAVGLVPEAARAAATRVLQGMIAISRLRWPDLRAAGAGLAGRDLDAIARMPLWLAGQDYDHGTGHGVGAFLSVHEGPQRLSRASEVALAPGMVLSNEPGYYREGAFGIRLENLVAVTEAPSLPEADNRPMLSFKTLTLVPLDRAMILADMLSAGERAWLNAYHADVHAQLAPRISETAREWLAKACAPL